MSPDFLELVKFLSLRTHFMRLSNLKSIVYKIKKLTYF